MTDRQASELYRRRSDHFYIEEHDRSAGIRIVPAAMPVGLVAGKTVDIGGMMRTEGGWRFIEAGAVIVM